MQDSLAHPVASGQVAEGAVLLEQLPDHLMAQVPPLTSQLHLSTKPLNEPSQLTLSTKAWHTSPQS